MSSLARSSGVCSEVIGRILFIFTIWICSVSFSARACRWEWSETRHSCGETARAFARAHRRACAIAEWLSPRVHEIRYWEVSDGGKLDSERHTILLRRQRLQNAAPCCAFPHHPVSAGFMRFVASCVAYTLQLTQNIFAKLKVQKINNIKCDVESEIK